MARKQQQPGLRPSDIRALITDRQGHGQSVTSLIRLPEQVLRETYSSLRDIAQKRLKRLQASEFAQNTSVKNILAKYPDGITKLRDIKDKRSLVYELADLNRILNNPYLTIKGLKETRAKNIATLHRHGFTYVNEENFGQFSQFMDYLHDSYKSLLTPSDMIVEDFFKENVDPKAKNADYLKEKFNKWLGNKGKLNPNTSKAKLKRRSKDNKSKKKRKK